MQQSNTRLKKKRMAQFCLAIALVVLRFLVAHHSVIDFFSMWNVVYLYGVCCPIATLSPALGRAIYPRVQQFLRIPVRIWLLFFVAAATYAL
jgi:hypothetical protein